MTHKVAITGANGLVGANLSRELLKKGYEVKALYFRNKHALENLNIETVKGNILNKELMNDFLKETDIVFHSAAIISIGNDSFEKLYEANVEGTKTVYNAAVKNNVKTFVFFSSIHAFKQQKGENSCSEDCDLALNSPFLYEKTKAIAQKWLIDQKGKGLKILILNPTAIIGPHDYSPSLIGEFIISVMKRKLPALVKGGYNWVDVRDVVKTAITASEKGKDCESYILAGKWESLIDITKMMEKITGEEYNIPVVPLWLAKTGLPFLWLWSKITGKTQLYTLKSLQVINMNTKNINYDKAKKELNYNPRSLEETLKDTMEWFKNHKYI